jgi:hypothetical protein
MIWNLIYAAAHIFLLMVCARLFCTAPDWMQKSVLLTVMASASMLLAYYLLLATGAVFDDPGAIVATILMVEHFGICIYIIRLWLQGYGLCKKSSTHSPVSARS